MLVRKGKITEEVVSSSCRGVIPASRPLRPQDSTDDEEAMENLARYVVRASFSQERMTYLPDESQVLYDLRMEKTRRSLMRWSGSPPCVPMFPTRENRWSDTMATTATSVGVNGRGK